MIVTRFAPSPTGYLHVGGARTALYSWLHARHHGGRFILRIEDTDQERSDPKMVEGIIDSMKWLGLDWDDGPFFQSERRALYNDLFGALDRTGLVYECYCTPSELAARRTASEGAAFRYDGRCRHLSAAERQSKIDAGIKPALRLKLSDEPKTIVNDLLRGEVVFDASVLDDLVIRKSDGFPTFHFAVAADDALMGVTDVIRGDDHLSNTPKQIRILEALQIATGDARFSVPRYAHLPLILGADGKRFSKRHGATAVGEYRERGYLPDAMVNFLALLGWSPGDDREIVTRDEMIDLFKLENVNKRGAVFDEVKLGWMNGKYISSLPIENVVEMLSAELAPFELSPARLAGWGIELPLAEWLPAVIGYGRERARVLRDVVEEVRFFLEEEIAIDPAAAAKHFRGEDLQARIEIGGEAIEAASPWSIEALDHEIRTRAEARGIKPPKVMHLLRVLTTGRAFSPGIFETIYYVGRKRSLERIRRHSPELRTEG